MRSSRNTITTGVLFFAGTCLIAVAGYWLAGWELVDSIYMVVITVYGVGYGEVNEITHPGLKVFTMGVIIAGCTSAIYVFGGFVQFLVEGEFNRYVGARRMKSEINKLDKHIILCGFGRVGQILARELHAHQAEFVVIDSDSSRCDIARELNYLTVEGNASDEETLIAAGIMRAQSLATVLSDDVLNVFVTLTARELNSELIIFARAENPTTEKKLQISGAHQVVLPAAIGARRIAESLLTRRRDAQEGRSDHPITSSPTYSSLEKLGFVLQRCEIGEGLAGLTLELLEKKIPSRFLTLELVLQTGEILPRPLPTQTLHLVDLLVILGPAGVSQKLDLLCQEKRQIRYRGASS